MLEIDPRELPPPVDPAPPLDVEFAWGRERMTPWERIVANDEVVNFADKVRSAMNVRNDQTLLLGKVR
jgi:hypothetical protein